MFNYACWFIINLAPQLNVILAENELRDFQSSLNNSNRNLLSKNIATDKSDYFKFLISMNLRKNFSNSLDPDFDSDEFDDDDDDSEMNDSGVGQYVGAPCEKTCDISLKHVICDSISLTCKCKKNYPVIIGLQRGCDKPKLLGEQCYFHQTCRYNDENSLCVQVKHNALCQCDEGFHIVSYSKPIRRNFCTHDIATLTSDLPTLLGVGTGIAVLAGLICMVLHLFSKTKYPQQNTHLRDNMPPQILYSNDQVQIDRPLSCTSLHSTGSLTSTNNGNRRPSSAPPSRTKGVLVSTSRTGSRRPSVTSIQSSRSSIKSYSMLRFEKELQNKELRREMKLRFDSLQKNESHPKSHYRGSLDEIEIIELPVVRKSISPLANEL